MKKKLSLAVSAALLITLMSACGSSDQIDSTNTLSVFGDTGDTETMETVTMAPVSSTPTTSAGGGVYTPELDENGNVVQGDEAVESDDTGDTGVQQGDTAVTQAPAGGITNSGDTEASPSTSGSGSGSSSGSSSGNSGSSSSGNSGSSSGNSGSSSSGNSGSSGKSENRSSLANALEDVLENKSLPGQTGSSGCMYAIADVDGDGSNEVIVRYPSGSGTSEAICSVGSDGTLTVQAQSYPGATYYSNGDIVVGTSSSMGYSGSRVSPYTIMSQDGGSYYTVASVEGWDKSLSETTTTVENEDGEEVEQTENSFPDAVDTDGNGYIYIINGGSDGYEMVDDSEYQAWYASVMGGASKVSVGFTSLTEDAIDALG